MMKHLKSNSHLLPSVVKPKLRQVARKNRKVLIAALTFLGLVCYFDISLLGTKRFLTANNLLGQDKCKWIAPEFLERNNTHNSTLLLSSYPGSGKRLTWRLFEALTGVRTGDDWNLSENGYDNVLTIKTSYPHYEGVWRWEDKMDHVVLLLRNPRHAIPSYFTMRHELDFSGSWRQSYIRRPFTYTERPEVSAWNRWRNANMYRQLNKWGFQIDFWMNGGMYGNYTDIGPVYSYHCEEENRHLKDCHPQAIIQFEKLYSDDDRVGAAEALKVASVLNTYPNLHVAAQEERECLYQEVMNRPEFYNRNRDGHGPTPDEFQFHYTQLDIMSKRLEEYIEKYSEDRWANDPNAQVLLPILQEYYDDIESEYLYSAAEYYADRGFTRDRVTHTFFRCENLLICEPPTQPPSMMPSPSPSDGPTIRVTPPPTIRVTPPPTIRVTPPPTIRVTPPPTIRVTPPPTIRVTSPPTINYTPPPTIRVTSPPTINYTPPPTIGATSPPTINYTPPPTINNNVVITSPPTAGATTNVLNPPGSSSSE